MLDILLATIVAVVIVLILATQVRLIGYLTNARVTYVDVLFLLCGAAILALLAMHMDMTRIFIPNAILLGAMFAIVILGVVTLWLMIKAIFVVPRVERVVRRGWINIWPQVIARRRINQAIVDHARAIMQMNLPLAEGFFLAGQQLRGRSGVVLQAMATFLHQGLKLSEAYGRYKARNGLVLSMMQMGERCGQLPGALAYLQDYFNRERKYRNGRLDAWWPYPLILTTITLATLGFTMVFVVPKIKQIFKDYGTTLPAPTQLLIHAAKWLVTGAPPPWFILAAVVALIVYLRLQPRRYPRPQLHQRLADALTWQLPGWRARREYTDLAHAAAILRLALASGQPLSQAVRGAAELDLHLVLRRRFRQFAEFLDRGDPVDAAGRKVHLPPRFLWALRPGQNHETLQASLELIEKYYSLVASHWVLALNAIAWPVVVVTIGLFVGFIVLAFFLPLVKLIRTAAAW